MKAGRFLHILAAVLLTLFLTGHTLLNSKKIQQETARRVVSIAGSVLETEVNAGAVQFSYPFGITIDGLTIYDLADDTLAYIGSATLRFKPTDLLFGRLHITSIRLRSPSIRLHKDSTDAPANYAFIMERFQGGEKADNDMALKANSILIRNGSVSYDVNSVPQTAHQFNTSHIAVSGLNANLSLKTLKNDSIAAVIRKFAFTEHSGFILNDLHGAFSIDEHSMTVNGLSLTTPGSSVRIDGLSAGVGLKGIPEPPVKLALNMNASVTGRDFKAFAPGASTLTEPVIININGFGDNSSFLLSQLDIHPRSRQFTIKGKGTISTDKSLHFKSLDGFHLTADAEETMAQWTENQLEGFGLQLTPLLSRAGGFSLDLNADGDVASPNITAQIISGAGTANLSLKGQNSTYNLSLTGDTIALGRLSGNNALGDCNLILTASGKRSDGSFYGNYDGHIKNIVFNGYSYRDIGVNGTVRDRSITTNLGFNDHNASLVLTADANLRGDIPSGHLKLKADSVNLNALKLSSTEDLELSFRMAVEASGNNADNIAARVIVDSLLYHDYADDWSMEHLTAAIGILDPKSGSRSISLFGDFFNASVIGEYDLTTLPGSIVKVCGYNLPELGKYITDRMGVKPVSEPGKDCFNAQATVYSTEVLKKVFHMPVSIDRPVSLTCFFDDKINKCDLNVNVPSLDIGEKHIENTILTFTADKEMTMLLSGTYGKEDDDKTVLKLSLNGSDDCLRSSVNWKNRTEGEFEGSLDATTFFGEYNRRDRSLNTSTSIDSTLIIAAGSVWELSRTGISTENGKIIISGLKATDGNQYLLADGSVSADSTDILALNMSRIDLEQIMDMFNANGKLGLKGIASGQMSAAGILGTPLLYGSIGIDGFEILDSYHGRLEANVGWNNADERIELEGDLHDGQESSTLLSGYFEPKSKFIEVNIDANHTDLHFLNLWTSVAFQDIGGKATGKLRLFGPLKGLNLEGEAILEDGYFVQNIINTTFIIKRDTLWFEPDRMLFKNVEFYDESGHDGIMTCILNHHTFSNWTVDMKAKVNGMQVYNVPKSEMNSIYAKVFANGSMTLKVNSNGLAVTADMKTAPGTRVGYSMSSPNVANYNFLAIVDRNTLTLNEDAVSAVIPSANTRKESRLSLDFDIQCTEDAVIDLSISSLNGSFRGTGDISAKYKPKDGVALNGLYNIRYGQCTLTLEDLIRKNFTLMDNSIVRFNGSPMDTEFDIHTYHSVNSVSMLDIDPTATSKNNVRVRCLMDISGNVSNPKLTFDVDMPSATAEERDLLASAISTEEQRNLQFLYLLAIGRFYTYDFSAQNPADDGLSPSAMESIVNSTVSGQINNLLSQVFDTETISFSSNLSASSYLSNDVTSLNNKEFEGILEAHLLNNRLLINGNFGYKENSITNTSNFIGDFEFRYKIFPEYGISLKGYSRDNDRYFSKTVLTTQGVGLVFDKDFNNWFRKK
ncbi:MAG: hypothetical protein IKS24_07830 [Bacteroidaceae bacterium]|nr:hypothetical protein [Bacteroidaceae bacterium]